MATVLVEKAPRSVSCRGVREGRSSFRGGRHEVESDTAEETMSAVVKLAKKICVLRRLLADCGMPIDAAF